MKKIRILSMLSLVLLTSCRIGRQIEINYPSEWRIDTLELADEYFPKYFEMVEKSLANNDIEYEKKYSEWYYPKKNYKYYMASYYITDNIYYKFKYSFREIKGTIESEFNYKMATEEEIFSIPQKYFNVMTEVTNFCTYNFLGTGDEFNILYNNAELRYSKGEITRETKGYHWIISGNSYDDFYMDKTVQLYFKDSEYNLVVCLDDYLLDANVWNK